MKAPGPHDALHWQMGDSWAVREGDWKLIINARDTTQGDTGKERFPVFLSNPTSDPGEKTNFADQQPDLIKHLRQLHDTIYTQP
jgi:arylsulfatase A